MADHAAALRARLRSLAPAEEATPPTRQPTTTTDEGTADMPLELHPVYGADFREMAQHSHLDGGDLIGPAVRVFWPPSESDAANAARTAWSMKQQRELYDADPSVRFLKVVDPRTGDIAALARWHYYETGFADDMHAWELNGRAPDADETWPDGADGEVAKAALNPLLESRAQWMGTGPQWVLTTLKTREKYRRRGAGALLVDWGVQQAYADGVPAFLEAGPLGVSLYLKRGFEKVSEQKIDLSHYGKGEFTIVRMVANKKAWRKES